MQSWSLSPEYLLSGLTPDLTLLQNKKTSLNSSERQQTSYFMPEMLGNVLLCFNNRVVQNIFRKEKQSINITNQSDAIKRILESNWWSSLPIIQGTSYMLSINHQILGWCAQLMKNKQLAIHNLY